MKPSGSLALWIVAFVLSASVAVVSAQAEYARVTGKVLDENGEPVAGLTIRFQPAGGSAVAGFTVTTNKRGRFTYPTAMAGSFDPRVQGEWYATRIQVKHMGAQSIAGGGDLDARLQPGEQPPTLSWLRGGRVQVELTVAAGAGGGAGGTVAGLDDAAPELKELNALFDAKDWTALLDQSVAIIADNPELGGAHYLRGVALWQTDVIAEAVESMRAAAEYMPDQPGINGTLATLLLTHGEHLTEQGDEAAALEAYGEAADLFYAQLDETPDEVVYLTNRVASLDLAGRTDELPEAIEELLLFDATNLSAYLRLAELHVFAGDIDAAFTVLSEMPEGGESAASILYNAAVDLWNAGDLEATVAVLDKGFELAPDMADLYRLKAMTLITSDQPQAVELLEKYLAMVPEDTAGLAADRELLEALRARL